MEKENIIRKKSRAFALRIVKMYKYLTAEKHEFILSKQVLRSGTSIGANIEESVGCSTRKDFINKMSIAYRESRETMYWLILLNEADYIDDKGFHSLKIDCDELLKILGKIISTSKKSIDN